MRQISVGPRDLPSTFPSSVGPSVNFPCVHGNFCQHSVLAQELRETSVNFCVTFRQLSVLPQVLSSAFGMAAGLSIKFQQLSVHPWDLLSTSINFPCVCSTFHQLPSTFCAPAGSSVNNLHGRRTYRQHQLTFRASAGLTVNLCQLFMRPGDLLSTFDFPSSSLYPWDLSTSFNFPLLLKLA